MLAMSVAVISCIVYVEVFGTFRLFGSTSRQTFGDYKQPHC